MEKNLEVYPSKVRTKDVYFFHVVGTHVHYKYLVNENKLQIISHNVIFKEINDIHMTFEDFEGECRWALQAAAMVNFGVN